VDKPYGAVTVNAARISVPDAESRSCEDDLGTSRGRLRAVFFGRKISPQEFDAVA